MQKTVHKSVSLCYNVLGICVRIACVPFQEGVMDISSILNIILVVFGLIGIAIGFHRGLFDQLLSWAIILVAFLFPVWITNAAYFNGNELSAIGQSWTNTGASFGINITGTPIEHFINSKFLEGSAYATAQDFMNGTIGYIIVLVICLAVFIIISIVGLHFAGHYIKKYRNLRKNFRTFDTIGGGVFGIVNGVVAWLIVSAVVNAIMPVINNLM